jgi:hypothetical protein
MSIKKRLLLINTFYNYFKVFTLFISLAMSCLLFQNGMKAFFMVFWFKIACYGLVIYFIANYKKNEFLYFQNLGFSIRKLWVCSLILDFSIFIFLTVLSQKIR